MTRPIAPASCLVALAAAVSAISVPAAADFVLTAPDGRKVELRDDKTWRYLPKVSQPATSSRLIQDIWNQSGCGLTGSAAVRLRRAEPSVERIVTWYRWRSDQTTARASLYDANGETVISGSIKRGSCDTYQRDWCEGVMAVNRQLNAGSYYLQVVPPMICQNAQSNGRGFIRVYAQGGAAPPANSGAPNVSGLAGYTKTAHAAISGHNNRHLKNVSPADCARACDREASFTCKSFDYYRNSSACDLSDKSASDVGLKRNYEPYDHYSRR